MGVYATGSRERNKVETRGAIQLAAVELFEEKGYDATTVDDIARRAAVAPRTFFRYFPSKELTLFGEDVPSQLASLISSAPSEFGPVEALRWAVSGFAQHETTPLGRRRQALRRRLQAQPAIERHLTHLHETLGIRLRAALAERLTNTGKAPRPDRRPEVLVALYLGLARELTKEEEPPAEVIEHWFASVDALLTA